MEKIIINHVLKFINKVVDDENSLTYSIDIIVDKIENNKIYFKVKEHEHIEVFVYFNILNLKFELLDGHNHDHYYKKNIILNELFLSVRRKLLLKKIK